MTDNTDIRRSAATSTRSNKSAAPDLPADPSPATNPYRRSLLRQHRSRQTRERIARAAISLWRDNGFDGTTIEDIAAAAGVGCSTFYYHFGGKDGLLGELGAMTARAVEADIAARGAIAPHENGLEDRLQYFVGGITRRLKGMPRDVLRVAAGRNINNVGSLSAASTDAPNFQTTLTRIFHEAQEAGQLDPALEAQEVAAVFTAMLLEGILRWSVGDVPGDDLGAVLRLRARLLLTGVAADNHPARLPT